MGTVVIAVVGNVIATPPNIDEDCLWKSSVRN